MTHTSWDEIKKLIDDAEEYYHTSEHLISDISVLDTIIPRMIGFYKIKNVDFECSPVIAVLDNIFNRNVCTIYSPNGVRKELHRSILLDYEKIDDDDVAHDMWTDEYNRESFDDGDIDDIVREAMKLNRQEYFKQLSQLDHRRLVSMIMEDDKMFDLICVKLDNENKHQHNM